LAEECIAWPDAKKKQMMGDALRDCSRAFFFFTSDKWLKALLPCSDCATAMDGVVTRGTRLLAIPRPRKEIHGSLPSPLHLSSQFFLRRNVGFDGHESRYELRQWQGLRSSSYLERNTSVGRKKGTP
jgi:hypothetical protein